jgi:transposase InsO family protein
VRLRKTLSKQGLDAGAETIRTHLQTAGTDRLPSTSTIWRILTRRGFVTAQPRKRPKGAGKRFCADMPNERWQADITHWQLADSTSVEILNIVDDHSRLNLLSKARITTTGPDVLVSFRAAFRRYGIPASVLTDNGAVFTGKPRRGGRVALEIELDLLGVRLHHSRPYHPQTCGKVERFHQTQKKWLAAQPAPATLADLQRQLDRFRRYYNTVRPHRAIERRTPEHAYTARPKAKPTKPSIPVHYRVRRDRIDTSGVITIATTADCATSASAASTPANESSPSSPTSTSASSTPKPANSYANSPSTPAATTNPAADHQALDPKTP